MTAQVISRYSDRLGPVISSGIRMPGAIFNSGDIAGSSQALQNTFLPGPKTRLGISLGYYSSILGRGWAPTFLLGPAKFIENIRKERKENEIPSCSLKKTDSQCFLVCI